jgi:putative tricarboxylic transport membrane protein
MDLFNNLALGFGVAFTFQNLAYAFLGCLLGTLIGVLPGIGPVATICHAAACDLCAAPR